MKIIVPVKQVVDPGSSNFISTDGAKIINPFCAIALEQAVRLKEQGVATEIVAVSICDISAKNTLNKALASGADRAVLIEMDLNTLLCSLDVANILSDFVKNENADLVIMGKQSVDSDNNQTGQMLSALLEWPQVIAASNISHNDNTFIVEREIDDGLQTLSFSAPGIITVDLRLNVPRFTGLSDIMKSKSKPLQILDGNDFNCSTSLHLEQLEVITPQKKVSLEMLENVSDLADVIKHTLNNNLVLLSK
jgi:electron transfer flavoprotein beta subunit